MNLTELRQTIDQLGLKIKKINLCCEEYLIKNQWVKPSVKNVLLIMQFHGKKSFL